MSVEAIHASLGRNYRTRDSLINVLLPNHFFLLGHSIVLNGRKVTLDSDTRYPFKDSTQSAEGVTKNAPE